MKCPNCSNEINDGAAFCGYCGKSCAVQEISPVQNIEPQKTDVPQADFQTPAKDVVPPKSKKKKRTGLKIFLFFVLLAVIAGCILGFLTAKGIVNWKNIVHYNELKWTEFQEIENTEEDDSLESNDDSTNNNLVDDTSETDAKLPDSDDTLDAKQSQDTYELTDPLEFVEKQYYKYIDNNIIMVDDKAHVLSSDSISNIFTTASNLAELSKYSIVIVIKNNILETSIEGFTEGYYKGILQSYYEYEAFSEDGYLLLIDPEEHSFEISMFGTASTAFAENSEINSVFDDMRQYIEAENYETAVIRLLENTPY